MSGPRRRRSGLRRQRVARAVADCFLAAALQQQPFLQAFGRVAIHAMVQPAALFGTLGPLILGCRPLARRGLRLRRNGRRHKNRQGNRERPEVNRHVRILPRCRQRDEHAQDNIHRATPDRKFNPAAKPERPAGSVIRSGTQFDGRFSARRNSSAGDFYLLLDVRQAKALPTAICRSSIVDDSLRRVRARRPRCAGRCGTARRAALRMRQRGLKCPSLAPSDRAVSGHNAGPVS